MRRLLLPILLLASATSASAQGADIVKVQADVGPVGADGFIRGRTGKGDLALELPCPYNELSIRDDRPAEPGQHRANGGSALHCDNVEGGAAQMALGLSTSYNSGSTGADHFFNQQFADVSRRGQANRIEFKGKPAYRGFVKDQEGCTWYLSVRVSDRLVSVTYFVQTLQCDSFKARAERIINSLEFSQ